VLSKYQKPDPATIERIIFYLLIAVNLIPVLAYHYFPTVDGPAHLYNSRQFIELLNHHDSPLKYSFTINTAVNPNWSGHFILAVFLSFLPAFMAEKMVLLIYLIGLPLSFRYFIGSLNKKNYYLSYLIFPFTYSFLFYFGFYNFNIGLVFLFIGIPLWKRYYNDYNLSHAVKLMLVIAAICLSHLFVFGIFLLAVFFIHLKDYLNFFAKNLSGKKYALRNYFFQFVILFPSLFILVYYFVTQQAEPAKPEFSEWAFLWHNISEVSPAKGMNYGPAGEFTRMLRWVILLPFFYMFVDLIITGHKEKWKFRYNGLLVITFVCFALIFILPDARGAAIGFVSARLNVFLFLFFIAFLASFTYPSWYKYLVAGLAVSISVSLLKINYDEAAPIVATANDVSAASDLIGPYSAVLPVIFSNDHLTGHIANYLGADKPMVLLENYEATMNHFPLKWNYSYIPIYELGDMRYPTECFGIVGSYVKNKKNPDYVLLIKDPGYSDKIECQQAVNQALKKDYKLLFKGADKKVSLYGLSENSGLKELKRLEPKEF